MFAVNEVGLAEFISGRGVARMQTIFAYIGAAVIMLGTAVMVYAPETYYELDRAVQTAEKANAQVQQVADAAELTTD